MLKPEMHFLKHMREWLLRSEIKDIYSITKQEDSESKTPFISMKKITNHENGCVFPKTVPKHTFQAQDGGIAVGLG